MSSRYKQKTASTGIEALKEALAEKEQHVESLITERDVERSELMELHVSASDTKQQLQSLQDTFDAVSTLACVFVCL